MKGRGDIVLVATYELGHQPLSLALAQGFLRRAGFAPVCLDLSVEPFDEEAEALLRGARLVAFAAPMHTALRLAVPVARRARVLRPDAHITFFGLYAPLSSAVLRREGLCDSILGVEAETHLVDLARALDAGRPVPAPPQRLGRLPFLTPERDGLPPLDRYAHLAMGDEHRVTGYVETTRGCRHRCRHCPLPPVYDGRFFALPLEVLREDLARQLAAGARHITFGDPDFFNAPKHALAAARTLHELDPAATFDATIKIEHLVTHARHLAELRDLGCVFIVSAVESLSDRVLAILQKGHGRDDVVRALELVRGAGISLRPTFVPFTPWTTLGDYLELCDFVRENELTDEVDPVQLALRLLVPPGSLLLQLPEMRAHLGPLDEEGLTVRWRHPDPRMERLWVEVMALAEQGAESEEAPRDTFHRIHAAATRAAGLPEAPWPALASPRPPPPRLTEAWFC